VERYSHYYVIFYKIIIIDKLIQSTLE